VKLIELLITHGANIWGQLSDRSQDTALHVAIKSGNDDVVRLLIERMHDQGRLSENINLLGNLHSTPLHMAMVRTNWDLSMQLIEHGADLEILNSRGCHALDLAIAAREKKIFKHIRDHPRAPKLWLSQNMARYLWAGIRAEDVVRVKMVTGLIHRKVINITPPTLHLIIERHRSGNNCSALIKALIKGGSDVNYVRKPTGETPLHAALRHYATEPECTKEDLLKTIEYLISASTNFSHYTKKGDTVLHYAARYGCDPAIALLLPKMNKAHIIATNISGVSALQEAVRRPGNNRKAKKLLFTAREEIQKLEISTIVQRRRSSNSSSGVFSSPENSPTKLVLPFQKSIEKLRLSGRPREVSPPRKVVDVVEIEERLGERGVV